MFGRGDELDRLAKCPCYKRRYWSGETADVVGTGVGPTCLAAGKKGGDDE